VSVAPPIVQQNWRGDPVGRIDSHLKSGVGTGVDEYYYGEG